MNASSNKNKRLRWELDKGFAEPRAYSGEHVSIEANRFAVQTSATADPQSNPGAKHIRALCCTFGFTPCALLLGASLVQAQETLRYSSDDQAAPETETTRESSSRYNIPLGSGGLGFSAGVRTVYVDNVYLTQNGARDDFILVPECDIGAFFPIGQSNTVVLDVGLAYYQYLKNTSLNTGVPLINPNSELAFNLRSGDFNLRLSESFSFQQSPVYESGSEFYNLYNTALFERYFNRIGALLTWDQNKLVMTAGYFHENLWADGSTYNYIDHASELFSADAMLATSSTLTVGLEAAGSLNNFESSPSYDTWRARVGPAFRVHVSSFLNFRFGGGYERIQYDSAEASSLGLMPEDTYYAYAGVEHRINRFFNHSLTFVHDNQLGFNAANLEESRIAYSLSWTPRKRLTISPAVSVAWYDESFGSTTANLYHEKFTYYLLGIAAHYDLGQHWRSSAGWDYRLKDSEIQGLGYAQNQAKIRAPFWIS